MALPKKQGLRKLQVENVNYYWKVVIKDGCTAIRIGITDTPNHRLLVVTPWLDPWLAVGNYPTIESEKNGVITPALVRQAIIFALTNNWSHSSNHNMILEYSNETFSIKNY